MAVQRFSPGGEFGRWIYRCQHFNIRRIDPWPLHLNLVDVRIWSDQTFLIEVITRTTSTEKKDGANKCLRVNTIIVEPARIEVRKRIGAAEDKTKPASRVG
jgi:hypothetical protein